MREGRRGVGEIKGEGGRETFIKPHINVTPFHNM
jgi:hypothetical protein